MTDLQPDTAEVLQEEPEYVMAVQGCVSVAGPVRTMELPSKGGGTRTRTATDTKAVQLLQADKRRKSAVLMSLDQEMYVGFSQAAMQDTVSMAAWPKAVPFYVPAAVDVYVQCAASGQSTRVSAISYLWAEG
ncbi:hypothetical protein QBA54_50805 [Streptomyces sp. B21-108]|uniref:hypothetical protein n=1 Tax=Streptomyces sp. B21-108 TaxID=3039419 RepID=UPI002FF0A3E0